MKNAVMKNVASPKGVSNNSIVEESLEAEEGENLGPKLGLAARLSAALFVSSRPLTIKDLAKASHEKYADVEAALYVLSALYKDEIHGFSLKQVQGGYQFRTSPGAKEIVTEIQPPKVRKFSRAAAETLAVIAYKQPVQRAEIEAIRGVDALPTLKTLLDARVVRAIGRDDEVGKPVLYATTDHFLERFGLNDLTELPTLREMREMEGDPGEPELEELTEGEPIDTEVGETGESESEGEVISDQPTA